MWQEEDERKGGKDLWRPNESRGEAPEKRKSEERHAGERHARKGSLETRGTMAEDEGSWTHILQPQDLLGRGPVICMLLPRYVMRSGVGTRHGLHVARKPGGHDDPLALPRPPSPPPPAASVRGWGCRATRAHGPAPAPVPSLTRCGCLDMASSC